MKLDKHDLCAVHAGLICPSARVLRGGPQLRRVHIGNPLIRPVIGGVSAAHLNVSTGTLGYFFRSTHPDDSPEDVFVLSTCHVFADSNRGKIGDPLLQCAPMDGGGAPQTHFARLHRYVPLHLDSDTPNLLDVAVGKLDNNVPYENRIADIGTVDGCRPVRLGERVRFRGNASGLTEGRVTATDCSARVSLDHRNPLRWIPFSGAIRIEPEHCGARFGRPGDSGALVIAESDTLAVGVYFAGARDGSYGLACPMEPVLDRLSLAFL